MFLSGGALRVGGELACRLSVYLRAASALRGDGDWLALLWSPTGRAALVGAYRARRVAYKQSCSSYLACPL